jgi:hypothetical protein
MSEKVRKVKVILTLDDLFQEGETLFEFLDYPDHFAPSRLNYHQRASK